MIIKCEKCGTKFNFEESLLKKNGSKVRCSVCRHVFLAYPPVLATADQDEVVSAAEEGFEKTIALDSPPTFEDVTVGIEEGDEEIDFDGLFDKPIEGEDSEEGFTPPDMEEEERGDIERIAVPARKVTGKSHLLTVFLVIILILIVSSAAVFFFAPDLIPDSVPFLKKEKKQVITDMGVRRLTLKAVTGSFVSSKEAGQLFVIRGMVGNNYLKSRSFILIKGNILDNKGQVVKSKTAYAGNTFKDEEINKLPLEEINKALKNRIGMNKKNFNVAQGTYIPFMIVFENLPENLSEFTVEVVSSFPGKE
jgi:predicted Zn finger-like uncharacterized protein